MSYAATATASDEDVIELETEPTALPIANIMAIIAIKITIPIAITVPPAAANAIRQPFFELLFVF